jgi:hypothetical protein
VPDGPALDESRLLEPREVRPHAGRVQRKVPGDLFDRRGSPQLGEVRVRAGPHGLCERVIFHYF